MSENPVWKTVKDAAVALGREDKTILKYLAEGILVGKRLTENSPWYDITKPSSKIEPTASVKEEVKPHEETEHEKKLRLLDEEIAEHNKIVARDEALGKRKLPDKLAELQVTLNTGWQQLQEGEAKVNEREAKVTERELAVNARIQEVNAWITSKKGEVETYYAQRKEEADAYVGACKKKGDDDVKEVAEEAKKIRADAMEARQLISQKDTEVLRKQKLLASAEFKELEEVFKSYLPSPQRYRGIEVHPDTYDTEQGGVATDSVLLPISYEKRLIAWQLRYPEYYEWACGKHKTPVARLKELEKKYPQLIKNIAAIAIALEKGVSPQEIKRRLVEAARARKR